MNNTEEYILNIDKPSKIDLYAKEGEKNSRVMKIKLSSKGNIIKPEPGDEAIFRFCKADGYSGINPAVIESDGTITVVLTDQVLACKGMVYCDITILNSNKDEVISTSTFSFNTDFVPSSNDQLESSNEFAYLVEATKRAENAAKRAEDAANGIGILKDGPFIRAEFFGAVGNGVIDDSDALQRAIDSGSPIQLSNKTYLINKTLVFKGNNRVFDGSLATLLYRGTDSALRITACSNSVVKIANIFSSFGSGVEFVSTSNNEFVQYINFYFNEIRSKFNCIKIDVAGGWCTEIRIHNGRFAKGNNGLYIKNNVLANGINSINLYNVGIEGVTNGIFCDAVQGEIKCILSIGHRSAEAFEKLLITRGSCRQIRMFSSIPVMEKQLDLSAQTRMIYINQPILDSGFIPVSNRLTYDKGNFSVVEPFRDTNRVLNCTNAKGIVDVAALTKGDIFKNIDIIFVGQNTTEIKLTKQYGDVNGINDFYVACSRDDSTPFKITDGSGNTIFNFKKIYSWKWLHFHFLYDNKWLVSIFELSQ